MIVFERADTDLQLRIAIEPDQVYQIDEHVILYRGDDKPTPVLRVYFRNGGMAVVRDPNRDGMERIINSSKWGDYGPDSETG